MKKINRARVKKSYEGRVWNSRLGIVRGRARRARRHRRTPLRSAGRADTRSSPRSWTGSPSFLRSFICPNPRREMLIKIFGARWKADNYLLGSRDNLITVETRRIFFVLNVGGTRQGTFPCLLGEETGLRLASPPAGWLVVVCVKLHTRVLAGRGFSYTCTPSAPSASRSGHWQHSWAIARIRKPLIVWACVKSTTALNSSIARTQRRETTVRTRETIDKWTNWRSRGFRARRSAVWIFREARACHMIAGTVPSLGLGNEFRRFFFFAIWSD